MFKYILKRVLQAIPLLLVISFIVFGLIELAPFDVVDSLITPNMSAETIALIRLRHGLDEPFLTRYWLWLQNILHGNFGYSLVQGSSIAEELATRIPNTIRLVLPAYLTALILAILLGMVAGANRGRWQDALIDGLCSLGIASPTFWFAMLLIYFLGFRLNIFPIIGMYTVGAPRTFGNYLQHFMMPYLTLTFAFWPGLTRFIRASTIAQMNEDYVMVQKAFQATPWEIYSRHISRNILIPIVTQIGMALPMLVTGAIITESIFSWPGVGPYLMSATRALDFPIIMALMLLSATLVILGNLLSDILYSIVDPRIRRGGGSK